MKIVFLLHSYFKFLIGGSEYQALILAKELVKRNYEVHYIFINSTEEIIPECDEGIFLHPLKPIKKINFFGKPRFLYRKKIIKILEIIKPDYIYHRNLSAFLAIACKYCEINNCKTIWHIAIKSDVEKIKLKFTPGILINYLNKKYIEYGITNADIIITQEKYHNERLLRNYGRNDTLTINKFFSEVERKIHKIKPIKIVWVANIKSVKQPDKFVDLADKLNNCDCKFIMIGRDSISNEFVEMKKKISELDNIEFMGEQSIDKVNEILCNSHIFINTSLYEGGPPCTFIQAWMRQVPVISLIVDPDNILKNEKIGFHSININQMIIDIRKLVENDSLREKMGKKAQEYADTHYSINNVESIINLMKNRGVL